MTCTNSELQLEEVDCPLCGSDDNVRYLKTPDYLFGIPGNYTFSRCRICGHTYLNPRPTADTIHLAYPANYGPHRPSNVAEDQTAQTAGPARRPWYLRYLPLKYVPGLKSLYQWLTNDDSQPLPQLQTDKAGAAIELGCGTGGYLRKLKAAGWSVVGVEPGKQAAELARSADFSVYNGTLDDISIAEAPFDAAAAWMVIEHVIDPATTLRQLYDLLKPGGQILISVPNAGCWESAVFRSAWYGWEPPRHLHQFSAKRICRVLEAAGFQNIVVRHQRNILYVFGSLGIVFGRIPLMRRIGEWLIRYPESPRLWMQLITSPLAIILAAVRQGGRLTILAERPVQGDPSEALEASA